jgi:hypothetical protein
LQPNIVRSVLKAFDKAGLWQDGVELVGSWCFFMYQLHCGVKGLPLKTLDVDFLVPRPFLSRKTIDLVPVLQSLGFTREHNTDGSIYFQHPELKLEFITPEKGKGQTRPLEVKPLGLKMPPLRFLDRLFDEPMQLKEAGVTFNLPNPTAYALHKLILGQRRKKVPKRLKDIEQAVYVLAILNPGKVAKDLADYPPNWRKWIIASLRQAREQMPEEMAVIDPFLETIDKSH